MIAIVNYGIGNLGSILNMLQRIGVAAQVAQTPAAILAAEKLILPGVGAFDTGMASLGASGLRDVLDEKVVGQKTPVLGVCLGMQLLGRRSEEGQLPGLGWLDAETIRFRFDPKATGLKIPHMGWNTVRPANGTPIFAGFTEPPRFYFVHSYHMACADAGDVAATVHHGSDVTAAVARGHVMGVQFHPEKSHAYGMKLLRAFADLPPRTAPC